MSVNGQLSHRVLQFQNVVNIVHQYCFCTRESEAGRWEMHPITQKLWVGCLPETFILGLSFLHTYQTCHVFNFLRKETKI